MSARRSSALSLGLFLAVGLSSLAASAQVSATCDASRELDRYQLLRRLTLDLRGRSPTVEEYAALDGVDDVPPALVRSLMTGDEFRLAMRRYHEANLWPNVTNVRLHGTGPLIGLPANEVAWRNPNAGNAAPRRGDGTVGCGDFEQTHFDAAFPGQFRPDPAFVQSITVNGKAVKQEGWRWVTPYFAPTAPIKVCAYDAQETPSIVVGGATTPCAVANNGSNACGCGPNLRWCYNSNGTTARRILTSMREQLGLAVDEVTVGGRPYTELVLATHAYQNGALAFFKKNLAPAVTLTLTYNVADPQEEIAVKAWEDETWTKVDRKGLHAGVLTSPAFLLRFQTNRARANRFRIAFLGEHFVPPSVLSPQPGCSATTNDLMARCNCQYCHTTLEPLASHWGKFAEAGTTLLADTTLFPKAKPTCVGSAAVACTRFYVTQADAHNAGTQIPWQWVDQHPELGVAIDAGPRAAAKAAVDSGAFARATVKKLFAHFMKRPMHVEGANTEELVLLDELANGFRDSGHRLGWLVERLVTLPQYRRVL